MSKHVLWPMVLRLKSLLNNSASSNEKLEDIPTPACLVSSEAIFSNCDRMLATTRKMGITLRPMTKTHKTIEGTLIQLLGSEGIKSITEDQIATVEQLPITVSTMGEAEFFAQHSFKNILYPYPASQDKLKRALALMVNQKVKMHFSFDNIDVLSNFLAFWEANKASFSEFPYSQIPVYVDVDPGDHRTGVNLDGTAGIELVKKILASPIVCLHGIYVHGGFSYHATTAAGIEEAAVGERDTATKFRAKLEAAGLLSSSQKLVVATGSTPTATRHPQNMEGITEFHPGNYVLFDAHQALIGTCETGNCASTILTRVLSHYTEPQTRLLIDAGAFALSKDRGPVHAGSYSSYGLVQGHPDLIVSSISQEVGSIIAKEGHALNLSSFPIGSSVRIIPNHSCMSCYCYEYLNIVNANGQIVDKWKTCPRH